MQSAGPRLDRRSVVAATSALLTGAPAGCLADGGSSTGDDGATDATDANGDVNPALGETPQMGTLDLTSPAFEDGERIPEEYGRDRENVNPPLRIEGVPDGAETLALVVDDPDAVEPAGKVWDHWVVWNVPPDATEIPEDWQPEAAAQGTNDFGEVGYGGPAPPDREHRYRFKLFALDTSFDLPQGTDAESLGDAMEDRVVAQTQLDGTYPAE